MFGFELREAPAECFVLVVRGGVEQLVHCPAFGPVLRTTAEAAQTVSPGGIGTGPEVAANAVSYSAR